MRETTEFRVVERFASMIFADNEGERRSFIRKVEIETSDPRFADIGRLQHHLLATQDASFFHGWSLRRRYTREELARAACFQLIVPTVLEPTGEACGTRYDEATACQKCGAAATQVSDLRLDLRKAPKKKSIARTIAGEVIVSQRLAERMIDAGLTGFDLRPARHKARFEDTPLDLHQVPTGREILRRAEAADAPHPTGRFTVWVNRSENRTLLRQARDEFTAKEEGTRDWQEDLPVWHQLIVTSAQAEIVPPTRVGNDPFDDDPQGEYRCPLGHVLGLNLLSEVSISATTRGTADFVSSRQFIGVRRGYLRPKRIILASPKARDVLHAEDTRGANFEVAHLV